MAQSNISAWFPLCGAVGGGILLARCVGPRNGMPSQRRIASGGIGGILVMEAMDIGRELIKKRAPFPTTLMGGTAALAMVVSGSCLLHVGATGSTKWLDKLC